MTCLSTDSQFIQEAVDDALFSGNRHEKWIIERMKQL
jgi:hypothetical protein